MKWVDMDRVRASHIGSAVCGGLAALATVAAHRRWELAPTGTLRRGVLDICCHFGVACMVTVPVLSKTVNAREFGTIAVVSAVALDIDHIFAARSLEMRSWMSMPSRPPTHSIAAMIALAWAVERLAPGRRLWLAVALGVGSHLLRDLATGGAPIWHPRRVIRWTEPAVLAGLCLLPLVGWYLASLPPRQSRDSSRRLASF